MKKISTQYQHQLSKVDSIKSFTRVVLLSQDKGAWSTPHTEGGMSLYLPARPVVTFDLLRGGRESLCIQLRISFLKLCVCVCVCVCDVCVCVCVCVCVG